MTCPETDIRTPGWALTVEELRVVGLIAGVSLPSMLDLDLGDEDTALAEAFATRSLVARGLAVLDDKPSAALAPGAAAQLSPLLAPAVVVEVVVDVGADEPSRHVAVADQAGGVLSLGQRELDIWRVDRQDATLAGVVWSLLELPASTVPPTSTQLTMPAAVMVETERLARAGRWADLEQQLVDAGVDDTTATRWLNARRQQRLAGTVRLARLVRADVYELGEVRWMDAGPAGVWRLAGGDDGDGDEENVDSAPSVFIEDVGEAAVRDDLRALIGDE
ncbi:MAG: hypothetical protein M3Y91_18515 [Actinomycetota bacterium]|nr:hypothetical protein [Actinomycetota bacterium]